MLARLGHRAVSSGTHQNGAVHLSRTRDHVFHIIGVAWAVHVGVVTILCFVLDVSRVDRNTAGLLFRRCVDLVVRLSGAAKLGCQHGRDGRSQRGFTVVNVTDGAHVHVRLGPFKFLFSHFNSPKNLTRVLVLRLHQIADSLRTGTEWHLIADRFKFS